MAPHVALRDADPDFAAAVTAVEACGRPVLVACSAGVDSGVLAFVAAAARCEARLCYVDHGLNAAAPDAAEAVRALGRRLDLEVAVVSLDGAALRADPLGLEAAARDARYRRLAEVRRPDEVVLTAHTATDRLATTLMRLVQGAGLAGASGPEAALTLHGAPVRRPMLHWWRHDIERVARTLGFAPVDDPDNASDRFLRNRVEAAAEPLLALAEPKVLLRSLDRVATDSALLAGLIDRELDAVSTAVDQARRVFSRPGLAALAPELRGAVVAHALRRLAGVRADAATVERVAAASVTGGVAMGRGVRAECGRHWMRVEAVADSRRELAPLDVATRPARVGAECPFGRLSVRESPVELPEPGPFRALVDADAIDGPLVLRRAELRETMLSDPGRARTLGALASRDQLPAAERRDLMVVADRSGPLWIPGGRRALRAAVGADTRRALVLEWTLPGG